MKIIRLQSENVMRLVAVDVTPEGNLVIVGGANGAGKSSVLDSIAMALGGLALAPPEPIRAGEAEARIVVDLGDLRVTRRFSRERLVDADNEPIDKWSETRSTLTVTNRDGARYPSPQAMLDKLLGKLTFDPLAFKDDKDQAATLRRLVGIDTAKLDRERQLAVAERAAVARRRQIKEAQMMTLPHHDGVPDDEVSLQPLLDELKHADNYRAKAEEDEQAFNVADARRIGLEAQLQIKYAKIEDLQRQIAALQAEAASQEAQWKLAVADVDARRITADAARAVVPDTAEIRAQIADAEKTNAKVRDNRAKAASQRELDAFAAEWTLHDENIRAVDEQKRAMLANARFPVDGLGLSDEGVTFNGLPFRQASTAEQLRVSVAIGLALNPTLKVLLVRQGNALDDDSLAAVAAQAAEADAQVWLEYVTKNAEGVSVMIEDGRVAASEEE